MSLPDPVGGGRMHVLVENRRARLHRLVDVDDPGQNLVVDLDQLEGLRGDLCRCRCDRRYRMTRVQRLLARHHIAAVEAQVLDAENRRLVPRELHEIAAGHDGFDARQCRRLLELDRFDAGMGMGTAQDPSHQHAWHREVGAEGCTARHFVLAVRPEGALADPLVVRTVCRHLCSSYSVCRFAKLDISNRKAPAYLETEAHPRMASCGLASILQRSRLRTTAKHAMPVCPKSALHGP